ncbi:hypothetical protein ACLK1T_07555 [Escherichia coli]
MPDFLMLGWVFIVSGASFINEKLFRRFGGDVLMYLPRMFVLYQSHR